MNGFTTTETDAEEADLALKAERVAMAMAEAGFPTEVGVEFGTIFWRLLNGDDDDEALLVPRVAAFARALDLVGQPRRCIPCSLASMHLYGCYAPRVSPDCEGTGRCAVES